MSETRKSTVAIAALLACYALLTGFLMLRLHYSLLEPSQYDTYTRQAMAWREGRASLQEDVPHLELAIYKGEYYVSFPPFPSVPIYFLTFVFGSRVPDALLSLAYGLASLLLLFRYLHRKGFPPFISAAWSFLLVCASSMLPLVLTGAVWYQAQTLAFLLIVASLDRMDAGKPTLGLLLFALSVGCRPLHALYGPLLIFLYCRGHGAQQSASGRLKKLLPGLALGLLVAALYGLYNYARFGNALEFGHNHLPEFSIQGGSQFSFSHLGRNIQQFFFSLPFQRTPDGLEMNPFGFSLFLANPVLILLPAWALALAFQKALGREHIAILVFFSLHLFLLLLHRTFGGYQYGARYAVDLIPYAALFLARKGRKTLTITEAAVMLSGLALGIYGSLAVPL